jgi:hypothetical protein
LDFCYRFIVCKSLVTKVSAAFIAGKLTIARERAGVWQNTVYFKKVSVSDRGR